MDRVGDYIRTCARSAKLILDRRGIDASQFEDTRLDEEGLTLKIQLKQLHRWAWPLRELSSLIDTQQRSTSSKRKSSEVNEDHRQYLINRWSPHVQSFIPGLFGAIACLQAFCNPANAGGMPSGLQNIGVTVDISGWDEVAENVTSPDDADVKTVQHLVRRLQKNVRVARDYSYLPSSWSLTIVLD